MSSARPSSSAGPLDNERLEVAGTWRQVSDLPATLVAAVPAAAPAPVAANQDALAATLAAPILVTDPLAATLVAAALPVPDPYGPTLTMPAGNAPVKTLPAVDPLAATLAAPVPEVVSLPPTLTMPLGGIPMVPPAALAPTLAAPTPALATYPPPVSYSEAAWAATGATPVGALAPTELAPVPTVSPGPTLVMQRKQFAAAGLLLATLALGVVVLAIIVLRRSPEVVVSPNGPTPIGSPAAAPTPAAEVAVSSPALPPTVLDDPPVRPTPAMPPPETPLVSAPGRAGSQPSGAAPAETTGRATGAGRPTNTMPFVFDARAVVAEGDKHREREASVLVADGRLKVSQKDDKSLYVVALTDVVGLTYSNSKQPLWNSPSGPAEAMRVDGGAFGFLKGGRNNWFGVRTNESLLVLRVDDSMVARVIAGLQERIGLPVARLIEPKE